MTFQTQMRQMVPWANRMNEKYVEKQLINIQDE